MTLSIELAKSGNSSLRLALKIIHLLGDANYPAHSGRIVNALNKLCELIHEDAQALMRDFITLQEEKELYSQELRELLKSIFGEIKALGKRVKDARQIAVKSTKPDTTKAINYGLLEISMTQPMVNLPKSKIQKTSNQALIKEALFSNINASKKKAATSTLNQIPKTPIDKAGMRITLLKQNNNILSSLNKLTKELRTQLYSMQKTEGSAKQYIHLYNSLITMKNKAIYLMNEQQKSAERIGSANKTLRMTHQLAREMLIFVRQSPNKRKVGATHFFNKMHHKLYNKQSTSLVNNNTKQATTHLKNHGFFRIDRHKSSVANSKPGLKSPIKG